MKSHNIEQRNTASGVIKESLWNIPEVKLKSSSIGEEGSDPRLDKNSLNWSSLS